MELTASQADLEQKATLADRDEHITKLAADVRVLEDRLQQSEKHVLPASSLSLSWPCSSA